MIEDRAPEIVGMLPTSSEQLDSPRSLRMTRFSIPLPFLVVAAPRGMAVLGMTWIEGVVIQ